MSTKLSRLAKMSASYPEDVFTTLVHRMDVEFLKVAFGQLNRRAASGQDGVTAAEYETNLDENLQRLHERLKSKKYRAQPSIRRWIPKRDGAKRPLAIPALEDKIVQKAVSMLLGAVYEPMFLDCSHGFRPGRSCHTALEALRENCRTKNINWIVDADILGFFDNIDRGKLREVLHQRVNDGGITRLIGKWFHAGIMESGQLSVPDKGTPQGSIVSPLLANIFLHTVLDTWFETEVKPRMKGRCFMVRYCDDFVMGFELKTDADRLFEVLPKRFLKYNLELNMTKTKLVQFGRPAKGATKGNGTFDFLGFTHYFGKSMKGNWTIKRKTQSKTMRAKMAIIYQWCKDNMHKPVTVQYEKLCAKLLGHYQYYGVRGNYKMLEVFFEHVERSWKYWLGRRTRNGHIKWEKFDNVYRKYLPLPKPRITQTC